MAKLSVKYDDVFSRCKFISSYEAQSAKGAAGNNLYANIIITDADKSYIELWIEQGMKVLEARLNSVLTVESEFTTDDDENKIIELVIGKDLELSGAKQSGGSFVKAVNETLVSFCLQKWLEDKLKERSDGYSRMFEQMADSVVKIGLKKKKPTMEE